MRICIFSREYNSDYNNVVKTALDVVNKTKGQILFYENLRQKVNENFDLPSNTVFLEKNKPLAGHADLIVSLGGDGTLLETVNLILDSGIPVMGINFGRLGFLSNIQKEDFEEALNDFVENKHVLSPRSLLQIDNSEKIFGRNIYGLNEITIQKSDSSSMISVKAFINGEFVNNYWADGLILSTPTGSTAYSLSCTGPIMSPEAENFILTPISPHNLSTRPIVIPDNVVVELVPDGRTNSFIFSVDSFQANIPCGEKVVVRKAPFYLNFVRHNKDTFFSVIREKLMWGEDIRNYEKK